METPVEEVMSPESEEIAEILPKIIRSNADTLEIKRILKRTHRAARRLSWGFFPALGLVFLGSAAGLTLGAALALGHFFPQTHSAMRIMLAILPALLLAATLAHTAGTLAIRLISGLNHHARHCLALHLPWNRAPKEWPRYFRRWIYCGDWLIENLSGDLTPYIRAFVTGGEIHGVHAEIDIWNELMQATARGQQDITWETGHSVRELAKVDELPVWVRDITPGMNLSEMEKTLGNVGHAWAVNLLKRAAMRKKSFGNIDFNGDLHEALFEFHYCRLESGREGLLVVIRPHRENGTMYLGDSISDSLAA